jgi:hypothetical protein
LAEVCQSSIVAVIKANYAALALCGFFPYEPGASVVYFTGCLCLFPFFM